MRKATTAIGGIVLLAVCGSPAIADPPSTAITATGYAPQVCTVGAWSKVAGSGTLTGGMQAILTYDEADLVDANSMSVLDASRAFTVRIPVLCNTSMTWGINGTKGAFRNDADPATPPGFAKQWLYHLDVGPKNSSGGNVGSLYVHVDSDGTPIGGTVSNLNQALSQTVAYFALTFTPQSASQRMLAGHYSEVLTLTVEPGL